MIHCKYTIEWDDGRAITGSAQYDPETGAVEYAKVWSSEACCTRRFITLQSGLPEGDTIPVCPDCQTHVLKPVVADRADLSFGEVTECTNKECPSHA